MDNLKNLKFLKKSIKWFKNYLLVCLSRPKCLTKPLTTVPRYILIKSFILAIGWTCLQDLSLHVFLKRSKLL